MQTENNSERLALVTGNSFYSEAFTALGNSKKDAENIKVKLESLGFAVDNDPFVDRTHRDMLQDVLSFIKRIHNGVTDIVFYYAGHGCSIRKSFFYSVFFFLDGWNVELNSSSNPLEGKNFLVPIDGH